MAADAASCRKRSTARCSAASNRPTSAFRPASASSCTTRAPRKESSTRIICRRRGSMEAPEELLLDMNALAEGHPFLGLGAFVVERRRELSGVFAGYDRLPPVHPAGEGPADRRDAAGSGSNGSGSAVWAADNRTLLYTTEDAVSKRSDQAVAPRAGRGRAAISCSRSPTSCTTSAVGRSLDRADAVRRLVRARRRRSSASCRADDPAGRFALIVAA